jgi:hypothetical protein
MTTTITITIIFIQTSSLHEVFSCQHALPKAPPYKYLLGLVDPFSRSSLLHSYLPTKMGVSLVGTLSDGPTDRIWFSTALALLLIPYVSRRLCEGEWLIFASVCGRFVRMYWWGPLRSGHFVYVGSAECTSISFYQSI